MRRTKTAMKGAAVVTEIWKQRYQSISSSPDMGTTIYMMIQINGTSAGSEVLKTFESIKWDPYFYYLSDHHEEKHEVETNR